MASSSSVYCAAMSEFLAQTLTLSILGFLLSSCGGARPRVEQRPLAVPTVSPAVLAAEPAPRDDGRLPPEVMPTGYRLELNVAPEQPHFSGRVRIGLHVASPTRFIVLHGRQLRLHSASVSAPGDVQPAHFRFRQAAHGKGEADELVLSVSHDVPAGDATLDIEYDADFAEGLNGLYRVNDKGHFYAFTQFEPVGARLAFPCFDEPGAKVPFEMVVTVPTGEVALSNMPVAHETASATGDGVTFEFERSPPLPTYLVALAVGPLELREGKGASVPLRLAAVAGRSSLGDLALRTASDHLGVLERYFGMKYPYPKLDLVAVPNFSSGAMENAGLVTFREERLLVDEKTAPTSMRRALFGVIAHELSHMWFGDLVTMQWWDDIWLNEGFATWMATRVLDTWRPEMRAGVEALGSTGHALSADTLDSARRVRQPVRSTTEALEAFDGITYAKGAALLGMVERWLSPDVFRAGVLDYLTEHRFRNATGSDLFQALARASDKDVPAVLESFTEQTGVPSLEMEACRVESGRPTVHVTQKEYRPLGALPTSPPKTWVLPICVHYGEEAGGETEGQSCALLQNGGADLAIPSDLCPSFIHPNADQAGYYYSKSPLYALVELAALPAGTLRARERVGLLSDAWALVASGELDASSFLDLAGRFRHDEEPAVWEQITTAIETLSDVVVSEKEKPAFAEVVRGLLRPEAVALGWDARPKDGDPERMRRRLVLFTLGAVGRDPAVLGKARILADKWLTAPSAVDGDRAAIALPLAARDGDAKLFDRIVAVLKGDPTPAERVLAVGAIGAFSSPDLVRRALELILDGTVRAQDQGYVLGGLFGRSETRGVAFGVVAERLDAFLERIPPFARRRLVPVIARSCSAEEVERARALLTPRLAVLEGADRGFAQSLEEGARCAALRAHHEPPLTAWLDRRPHR
jgi:alanyl aminopeptidase